MPGGSSHTAPTGTARAGGARRSHSPGHRAAWRHTCRRSDPAPACSFHGEAPARGMLLPRDVPSTGEAPAPGRLLLGDAPARGCSCHGMLLLWDAPSCPGDAPARDAVIPGDAPARDCSFLPGASLPCWTPLPLGKLLQPSGRRMLLPDLPPQTQDPSPGLTADPFLAQPEHTNAGCPGKGDAVRAVQVAMPAVPRRCVPAGSWPSLTLP